MALHSLKQAHILIVDDAPTNIQLLEAMLRLEGYTNLHSLTDPHQTLPAYHDFAPDLILLDLMMPGLDGFTVMAQLKLVVPADSYLPILVLTGDIGAESKERALREGAKDFLTKPFEPTEVILRIQNLLQTRFLHLHLQQQNQSLQQNIQEVSQRRRESVAALEALRASEERLRLALDAARLGTWDWNVPREVEDLNGWELLDNCEVHLTSPRESFQGSFHSFLERVHQEDRGMVRQAALQSIRDCVDYDVEFRLCLEDGGEQWMLARGHATCEVTRSPHLQSVSPQQVSPQQVSPQQVSPQQVSPQQVKVLGIVMDITQRKQAERELASSREQLRALAGRLGSLIEEERTHIAREIHDELGTLLTGLKMDLIALGDWLEDTLVTARHRGKMPDADLKVIPLRPEPPPVFSHQQLQARLETMSHLIDQTVQTVRKIATELRPSVLDDIGLEAAIEWQVQDFEKRTGIHCNLVSSLEDLDVQPDLATAFFRILQESLTNVLRHAEATRVEVNLQTQENDVVLCITDNGRGITKEELANIKSLGILGMRERAFLLGGQVTMSGKPGEGTTVIVRIPFYPEL